MASYEHARVPIRAGIAFAVAQVSGVSLRWLATGAEPKKVRMLVDRKLRERIPENQLFSEAYDLVLMPLIEQGIAEIKKNSGGKSGAEMLDMIGDVGPDDVLNVINNQLRKILWETPPHLFQELYSLIYWDMWNFRHNHASLIENFSSTAPAQKSASGKIEYEGLTSNSLEGNTPNVQSEIQKLIERVKRKASKPGAKAELARTLGVAPARISEWLSGKKEPGGEYTLRLLKWVERT